MIAPTTSSLRSGERLFHQETGAPAGCGRGVDFPFEAGALRAAGSFPGEGFSVLPFGFPADLDDEEGVLIGMGSTAYLTRVRKFFELFVNRISNFEFAKLGGTLQKYSTNGLFFICLPLNCYEFAQLSMEIQFR